MRNSKQSTSTPLASVDSKLICIPLHTRFPVIYYMGRCSSDVREGCDAAIVFES